MDEYAAFQQLTPDQILSAVDSLGFVTDGRLLALNSYENRVYQVGLEDAEPLIAKFYRPQRWDDRAIIEEHRFCAELAAEEIPVVAPLVSRAGDTLHNYGPFRFALFPRRGGRPPELDDPQQLAVIGRFLARIHLRGELQPFQHRPTLDAESFGRQPANFLLTEGFIPPPLEEVYAGLIDHLLTAVGEKFAAAGTGSSLGQLRLHGDCHPSNVLWRDGVPHIVDFDDARSGPAVQDLWLFLAGERDYQTARLNDLISGYRQFRDFDPRELHLIEALRTLRIIHYAAWLAQRWQEPAFRQAFPWFNSPRYWDDHVLALREQQAALSEPPLTLL